MMDEDALDLRRLDWIAGNYAEIGALRLVPVGFLALLAAVMVGGFLELSVYWEGVFGVWGVSGAVCACWLVSLWYRRNYGMTPDTWPATGKEARHRAFAWAGAAAMVAVSVADFGLLASLLGYLAGVAVMGCMFVYLLREGRLWPQGAALTSLVVVGGLLQWPLTSAPGSGHATWLLALLGATLLVVGVTDHVRLARAAKPLEDEGGK